VSVTGMSLDVAQELRAICGEDNARRNQGDGEIDHDGTNPHDDPLGQLDDTRMPGGSRKMLKPG